MRFTGNAMQTKATALPGKSSTIYGRGIKSLLSALITAPLSPAMLVNRPMLTAEGEAQLKQYPNYVVVRYAYSACNRGSSGWSYPRWRRT